MGRPPFLGLFVSNQRGKTTEWLMDMQGHTKRDHIREGLENNFAIPTERSPMIPILDEYRAI